MIKNPRIIAGKYKGFKLKVPDDIRPISDRVKTTLFDIIGPEIRSKNVIDFFSGSGSIGLEAISRGAQFAIFLDKSKDSIEILKDNIAKLRIESKYYKILELKFHQFDINITGKFDYIFLDPPFSYVFDIKLEKISTLFNTDSIGIIKLPSAEIENIKKFCKKILKTFNIFREVKLGENLLIFFRKK